MVKKGGEQQRVGGEKFKIRSAAQAAALLVKGRNKIQKPRLPDFLAFSRISTTVWVVSRAA